jgi:predicted DNA-binding transcriptional regulator YafY
METTILYRNYKGETRLRKITPIEVWFGSTEWHPIPQWMLKATDTEKNEIRDFAMADILTFYRPDEVVTPYEFQS